MTARLQIGKYLDWGSRVIWCELLFFGLQWFICFILVWLGIQFSIQFAGASPALVAAKGWIILDFISAAAWILWVFDFVSRLRRSKYERMEDVDDEQNAEDCILAIAEREDREAMDKPTQPDYLQSAERELNAAFDLSPHAPEAKLAVLAAQTYALIAIGHALEKLAGCVNDEAYHYTQVFHTAQWGQPGD